MHHHVDHAVVAQIFRFLKAVGQLLADGLLDHPRTGEADQRAGLETAVDRGTPFIMFAASGGARMQEGILSLMQMPRTTCLLYTSDAADE